MGFGPEAIGGIEPPKGGLKRPARERADAQDAAMRDPQDAITLANL